MEVRAGYKNTELGALPNDWIVDSLESLSSFISYGFTNPMPTTDSGVLMVTAKDVNHGQIQYNTARCTTWEAYKTLLTPKSKPKLNDILLTKDGTLGRLALVGDEIVCINQSVAIIRPKNKVDPLFLKKLLESPVYQKRMLDDAGGSTIKHIYITIVNQMLLGLPSLKAEQEEIAMALSDADALIESLEDLIEKKRQIKQGAMQELLTGKKRLPGFSDEWIETDLGEILSFLADYTANGSFEALKNNVRYYEDKNYAVLVRTTDLDKPFFLPERFTDKTGYDFLSKTALHGGEIVIANVGSIGKVFRVPNFDMPMTLAPNTYLLKFIDSISQDYIYQWMLTNEFYQKLMSKIGSTTLQAINKDNLRSIRIGLPSDENEQIGIAKILSSMDLDIHETELKLIKARQIKQGMMQELLTGRIRLV